MILREFFVIRDYVGKVCFRELYKSNSFLNMVICGFKGINLKVKKKVVYY